MSTQYHLSLSVWSHILFVYISATQSLYHVRTYRFRYMFLNTLTLLQRSGTCWIS